VTPKKCYMCEAVATSVEHVPPKCFFPEQKDLPVGEDFRKNLITVPSCEQHNTATSKDDEYALMTTVASLGTSDLAHHLFSTKIIRLIKRNPIFGTSVYTGQRVVEVAAGDGVAFKADVPRYNRVIRKIVYGIYYHHTGERLRRDFKIHVAHLRNFNPERDFNSRYVAPQMAAQLLINEPKFGDNPEVFFYQFSDDREKDEHLMQLVFYGGYVVLAWWGHAVIINVPDAERL
jgi:hypothetical protein